MFSLCLTTLVSSVITANSLGLSIDTNNKLVYNYGYRTQYVLPDKYNLYQLCKTPTRFAKGVDKPLNLISVIQN